MPNLKYEVKIGDVFGSNEVIGKGGRDSHRDQLWSVKCLGPNCTSPPRELKVYNLRKGGPCCACLYKKGYSKHPPITPGDRFGSLTVVSSADRQGTRRFWNYICDKGHEGVVRTDTLRLTTASGRGCATCIRSDTFPVFGVKFKDTKLTPLRDAGTHKTGAEVKTKLTVSCSCSPDVEFDIRLNNMLSGKTTSCGCDSQKSKPEQKVFEAVHSVFPDTEHRIKGLLPHPRSEADILNRQLKLWAEYDGPFHYDWKRYGSQDEEKSRAALAKTQAKDAKKDADARALGYEIVRLRDDLYQKDPEWAELWVQAFFILRDTKRRLDKRVSNY